MEGNGIEWKAREEKKMVMKGWEGMGKKCKRWKVRKRMEWKVKVMGGRGEKNIENNLLLGRWEIDGEVDNKQGL